MDQKYDTVIESIGIYLPDNAVSTKEVLSGCRKKVRFPMERMTGIKFRRMAGETEFSIDIAKKAIEDCLKNSKYNPEDIDLLICCNISRCDEPGFRFTAEPGTAVKLKKHFGFSNALAFDITNACTGMWTGVYIVDTFLKSGIIRCGLVVSGEYITHLARTAQKEIKGFMDTRLACLTLGDAGAALTLERSTNREAGIKKMEMFTLGKYSRFCIAKPSEEAAGPIMITELIKLSTVTLKYAMLLTEHVRKLSGWAPEDFNHIIMHQVSKIALDDAKRQINKFYKKEICTDENLINNLAERGNTASTSHILALKEFILNGAIKSGEKVLFTATGSGLTVGTAFYTMDDLPDRLRQTETTGQGPQKIAKKTGKPGVSSLSLPRIRIESIGTIAKDKAVTKGSIELVRAAAEDCFGKSSYDRSDIDLLIFSGVYRSDHIFEPAIAPMITGDLKINETIDKAEDKKTFGFDIFNGAVGFLNACYVAGRMIRAKRAKTAMIVTSEVENNATDFPEELYGIEETGSAFILDESPGEKSGFGHYVFKYFPDYEDSIKVMIDSGSEITHLDIRKDPALYDRYIECIPDTAQELLDSRNLDMSQIKVIFPPQISSRFIAKLSKKMNLPADKFVDVTTDGKDLFTSSIPYALQYAKDNHLVGDGDIGLIISAGSGIQIGCATYCF